MPEAERIGDLADGELRGGQELLGFLDKLEMNMLLGV
jgi:hypothetical protein